MQLNRSLEPGCKLDNDPGAFNILLLFRANHDLPAFIHFLTNFHQLYYHAFQRNQFANLPAYIYDPHGELIVTRKSHVLLNLSY